MIYEMCVINDKTYAQIKRVTNYWMKLRQLTVGDKLRRNYDGQRQNCDGLRQISG
jgi:hypothetical protein